LVGAAHIKPIVNPLKDLQSFRYERDGVSAATSSAKLNAPAKSPKGMSKEDRHYLKWKGKACRKFLHMERMGIASRGKYLVDAINTIQVELDGEAGIAIRGKKRKRGGRQKKTSYTLVGPKRFASRSEAVRDTRQAAGDVSVQPQRTRGAAGPVRPAVPGTRVRLGGCRLGSGPRPRRQLHPGPAAPRPRGPGVR
jgi:hypothetical protein